MRLFAVFFLFMTLEVQAEYRAFLLQISNADGTETKQIKSTLDPDQYRGYYTVKDTERIFYVDTWMCRGRTNDQPVCPSPRELAAETTEASDPAQTPSVTDTPAPPPPPAPSVPNSP